MNRSMLLLAAVASMFICCGTSLTTLQQAEMDFNAKTSKDSEAQKALKEAKAKLALEYAKEAASAAEVALTMTKKAVEQRKKACELMATPTPECDEILGKKPTTETPKEEKAEAEPEPDFKVEPVGGEALFFIRIDSFSNSGTTALTAKPKEWTVKFVGDKLTVTEGNVSNVVLRKKEWEPGCYKLAKTWASPIVCPR